MQILVLYQNQSTSYIGIKYENFSKNIVQAKQKKHLKLPGLQEL